MSDPKRIITGDRVRQARLISGVTQDRMAELLGITCHALALIEQGTGIIPSVAHPEILAFITGFPPAFFYLAAGPHLAEGSLLLYRQERRSSP